MKHSVIWLFFFLVGFFSERVIIVPANFKN